MDCPAKVSQFCFSICVQQDIFRLQVAVDHVAGVEVSERRRDLRRHPGRLWFFEPPPRRSYELFIKFPSWCKLKDQIDIFQVPEVGVQAQAARVAQAGLHLHLAPQGGQAPGARRDRALEEDLEGHGGPGAGALAGAVHVAELPPPQGRADLKVPDGPWPFHFRRLVLCVLR